MGAHPLLLSKVGMFETSLEKPRINPSRYTTFLRCQYLFYVKYIRNLARVGKLPPYMMLGSLYHAASAAFDQRFLPEPKYPRWRDAVDDLIKEFRTARTYSPSDSEVIDVLKYDLQFFVEGGTTYEALDGKDYEVEVKPSRGYAAWRELVQASGWELVALEQRYAKDLGKVIVAPKPDSVIRENGKLWVVERKTTQQTAVKFKQRFRVDPQTTLEVMAVEDFFGEEVMGVYLLPTVYSRKRPANWRLNDIPTPLHRITFETPRPIPKSEVIKSSLEMNVDWFMDEVREKTITGRWLQNPANCMVGWSTCELYEVCWGHDQLSDLVERPSDDVAEALLRFTE